MKPQSKPTQKRSGLVLTVVLFIAVGCVIWYAIPKKVAPPGSLKYYSDDDGSTYFVDDANKTVPFQHNGKEAVMARVYETSAGKPFVAYLEKYTDEEKQLLERKLQEPPHKPGVALVKTAPQQSSGLLVKKPHDGKWISADDPAGKEIMKVVAPDGSTDTTPSVPE